MKVFLSGPVTGLKREHAEHNFDVAARLVEECWNERGDIDDLVMFVPTEAIPEDSPREDAMSDALSMLVNLDWDLVISLPGWKRSEGAKLERQVADAIGIATVNLEDFANCYLGDVYNLEFVYH